MTELMTEIAAWFDFTAAYDVRSAIER